MAPKAHSPELWYEVHWPRVVDETGITAFFRSLTGDRSTSVVALEIVATNGALSYRLGLTQRMASAATAALPSFVPGTMTTLITDKYVPAPTFAWEIGMSSRLRPLRQDDAEGITRTLVTALSTTREGETLILQWLLGPRLTPKRVGSKVLRPTNGASGVIDLVLHGASEMDAEERRATSQKIGDAGFRAIGRIGIAGASERRAQSLASRLTAALRTAEAPGVSIRVKRTSPDDLAHARASRDWPLSLNVRELTAISAVPLGDASYPGARVEGPIVRPAAPERSTVTRTVGTSTFPGDRREVGLSRQDALQHLHVLGPTGVGKSTLLLNLILQDIDAGVGVVVIDPKGDLISDVLARVPATRRDDVVVLDPADELRPVGLNVLAGGGRSPELIADQVLAVFHGLYADNWGPRTQDILHASLLTLAGRKDMTLCALPVLLSNERFRGRIVASLTDEIALKPFWHWFESISDGERQQAIAPVMNKLRAFLLRPRMRAVIGQSEPNFDLTEIFTRRKIVLVSLAKGVLGPEAAALLGSLFVSQLWQAALGRVRIAPERRHPVMAYVDEFQDYLHLPTDLTDVLAQARGLGVGLTMAHQHLAQLPAAMRSAVLSNARSRICFQLGPDDARTIAGTTKDLTSEDLAGLPRFEAYASLVSGGSVAPYASIRTTAPREPSTDPGALRARSREAYGQDIGAVETELTRLVGGLGSADADDERPIGRRRRA
jgi:hypothetical protein